MSRAVRTLALTVLLATLLLPHTAQAAVPPGSVVPPGSFVYGASYAQWSARWWQWALSIPASTNPLTDETGARCGVGQSGKVWFLAGVINTSGTAERTCDVPAGVSLFLPVLNVECSTLEAPPFHGNNAAELRACARDVAMTDLVAELDGQPVPNLPRYRVTSAPFTFTVPDGNVLGIPAGIGQAVSDGVWLMLNPLSPGSHTVHFKGTYPDFGPFTVDITYHLTVVPYPTVAPIDSRRNGLTYADWSARWWQWALAQPYTRNPIFDQTGEDCTVAQTGSVWFLAGTPGGTATRTCTIPTGKALFFPLVNLANDFPCPDPTFKPAPGQSLEAFLTEGARAAIDQTTLLEASLDGRSIPNLFNYRATSRLFYFTGHSSLTPANIPPPVWDPCLTGTRQPAVSDGYWLFLDPLPRGAHTLTFRARQDFSGGGSFEVTVTYNLTVAP